MNAAVVLKPVLPSGWSRAKGFSYGMDGGAGRMLFVAGQLAVDSGAAEVAHGLSFADQFIKCLENVVAVVRAAEGAPTQIASLRAFVTDMAAYKGAQPQIAMAWRALFGSHFPAMTMVEVSALYDERALVEIEAMAVLREEK